MPAKLLCLSADFCFDLFSQYAEWNHIILYKLCKRSFPALSKYFPFQKIKRLQGVLRDFYQGFEINYYSCRFEYYLSSSTSPLHHAVDVFSLIIFSNSSVKFL